MVNEKELESFKYDEGDVGDIADKALVVLSYMEGIDGLSSVSKKMAEKVMNSNSKEEIADLLNAACNAVLKNPPKDRRVWESLYKALFGNNPYLLESHYTPKDENDAVETFKKCIREKKRIRTDIPEGYIV